MQHARGSCLQHRWRSPVGKSERRGEHMHAACAGQLPSASVALTAASSVRSHLRGSSVALRGSSVALTSAPSERSHLAISRFPFMHASTNGSSPSSLGLVTDAPRARSALASSRSSSRTCHIVRQSRLISRHQPAISRRASHHPQGARAISGSNHGSSVALHRHFKSASSRSSSHTASVRSTSVEFHASSAFSASSRSVGMLLSDVMNASTVDD